MSWPDDDEHVLEKGGRVKVVDVTLEVLRVGRGLFFKRRGAEEFY